MINTIKSVLTTAKIIFSNGSTYTIPFKNNNQSTDLSTYGTSCKLVQSLYKGSNTNVIGNICCGYLSIDGYSHDKLLIPTNEDSEYYGLMNDTAKIEIKCLGNDNVETLMGVYYVETWESGASSDKYDTFYISCVDIMSKIKKISLPRISIKQHTKFSEYLIRVIETLNSYLPNDMKINYTLSVLENIDQFYNSGWSMYYNNINGDTIESIFNTLAQNTLAYIWIDRNRYLQVDSLLDDDLEQVVCELSGHTNLFNYDIQQGDVTSFSGVNVNYIEKVLYKDQQLLSLNNYQLFSGRNKLIANLNSDKTIKINLIQIKCYDHTANVLCTDFSNYNGQIEMYIESSQNAKVDIVVYGTVIEEVYNNYIVYKNNENNNNLLQINNHILRYEDIPTYAENFVRLISMHNANISVNGLINPQLKVSDMVSVEGTRLGIDGHYKVLELEFDLGSNYRCKARLMKTIEGLVAIESMLMNDNIQVMFMNGGSVNTTYVFYTPTSAAEESRIENYLGDELDALREFL